MITGITDDTRDLVRLVIEDGVARGAGPRAVALELIGRLDKRTGKRVGGMIGLNSQQAQWVLSARRELAELDANYFTRERRDRRLDGIVRRAIRDDKPLTAEQIDQITGRYGDRLLQLRGETIARTESINGLRAGRNEAYRQLVDDGRVRDDQLTRTWDSVGDGRTRDQHLAMEGQAVRGLNQPFVAPNGDRMMYPGDVSLGARPENTINCRCQEVIRLRLL